MAARRTELVGVEGTVVAGFEELASVLASQLGRRPSGGAALCVTHRGEVVVDVWGGTRNPAGDPWLRDTTALSFSTTKGIVSTLVHRLADRGVLDYDAPLSRLWPEFSGPGKDALTLRHVLAHRAGLHDVRALVEDASQMLDWEHMTRALAAAQPRFDRRGRSAYHGLTYGWLVGEIVRRATGMTVGEALARELGDPLGLDGAWLGCPPAERHRLAQLVLPGPPPRGARGWRRRVLRVGLRGAAALLGIDPAQTAAALMPAGMEELLASPRLLDAEVPAMNGVFTARSLARVYTMLACEGTIDGVRYLSQRTVREAGKVQGRGFDAVIGFPMRWRLGYHVVGTSRGAVAGAFGHYGYGGSGAFADPRRGLAVAMTVSRVSGTPVGDRRMLAIAAAAVRAADRRAGK